MASERQRRLEAFTCSSVALKFSECGMGFCPIDCGSAAWQEDGADRKHDSNDGDTLFYKRCHMLNNGIGSPVDGFA